MANYFWIKLYYDLLDDRKVGQLPDSLKWRFIECLLLAGETNEDGFLPVLEDMAWRLGRMTPEALTNDLSHLARAGLLELQMHPDGKERWYVTKFGARQKRREVGQRVAAFRARQQAAVTDSLPSGNGDETTRYTDKIRSDIDIDADKSQKYIHTEHIPEPIQALITALAEIGNTTYWADTHDKFVGAAYTLHGWDVTPEQIRAFPQWWTKHGYYDGKPALRSIVGSWKEFAEYTPDAELRARIPAEYADVVKR